MMSSELGLAEIAQYAAQPLVRVGGVAIGIGEPVEMVGRLVLAMQQRPRAGAVQDQEMRDLAGLISPHCRPSGTPDRPRARRSVDH